MLSWARLGKNLWLCLSTYLFPCRLAWETFLFFFWPGSTKASFFFTFLWASLGLLGWFLSGEVTQRQQCLFEYTFFCAFAQRSPRQISFFFYFTATPVVVVCCSWRNSNGYPESLKRRAGSCSSRASSRARIINTSPTTLYLQTCLTIHTIFTIHVC